MKPEPGTAETIVQSQNPAGRRAVPLSDGIHVLFTDPLTGNLCLGAEQNAGLSRLVRKYWFQPPRIAASSTPVLYAAAAETRFGIRVVAAFPAEAFIRRFRFFADTRFLMPDGVIARRQVLVFYTVPPDDINGDPHDERANRLRGRDWDSVGPKLPIYEAHARGADSLKTVQGQVMCLCDNLVELAVDASPEIIIWGFFKEAYAKTWALKSANYGALPVRTAVQPDGSLRRVDKEGDIDMVDAMHWNDGPSLRRSEDGLPLQVPARRSGDADSGEGSDTEGSDTEGSDTEGTDEWSSFEMEEGAIDVLSVEEGSGVTRVKLMLG